MSGAPATTGVRAKSLSEVQGTFAEHLRGHQRQLFGTTSSAWLAHVVQRLWDERKQEFRLEDIVRHGFRPGQARVLDLGTGCGSFVSLALDAGYDCWGVEWETWKLAVFPEKNRLLRRPDAWGRRVVAGVAERLPFRDGSFDCVTSAQILEHVSDPQQALREMIRVTRTGGGVHLRCPDYRSTYEPHYRLPWLPLCPRPLARAYLGMLGRPERGLSTLRYVTHPRILRWLGTIEEQGRRLVVVDDERVGFENAVRRRRLPSVPGAFLSWRAARYLAALGRREIGVRLFVRVLD
jgi:SAM-dependent methyltransferase